MTSPLAELFIEARRRNGWTQPELAKRLGMAQSRLSVIENGMEAIHNNKIAGTAIVLGQPESVVADAVRNTRILKKGGTPRISPYALVVEFTPLEHRRVLQYVRAQTELDRPEAWIRRKILDHLAERSK